MQTRSSSRLVSDQISNPTSSTNPNPKGHNRRRSKQRIENLNLEEHSHPVVMMADQHTMAELLCEPTEGYTEATMVPSILAEQFDLKYSLINMMTTDQFFGLEKDNPHDHIRWFNKITSTIKYKDVPSSAIKLMLFPFSLVGAARRWLEKEPSRSIHTWEDLDRYKDLLHACPHYGFTKLHQLDTFYNALNPSDQDSLNAAAGGNLLERITQDVLTIIENKSKVRNSRSKPIVSQVKACDVNSNSSEIAKLTHAVNQQTSDVTTVMTAMLKQFQATPPPAPVKVVEETCVTCGALAQQNQNVHLNELEKVKRMNKANMKAMQTQIDMVKHELRIEMKSSIQTSLSNQTNEIKNMMASLLQMNTASTSGSGSLPRNTIANLKGELKAITTRSGLVIDGPTQEKDEVQIQRIWQTFKQLHINITLADTLILMPKYQTMLKALLSNKEKLQELANTHLNENCSAVILKILLEKLGDPGKFLIPCGFSELKCKALADLGSSINLMPLSVWKKLGLPERIPTRMTLELANRAICTPAGIARDVFVLVGKFTFPADFVIFDYESDPIVPFILGRPFLQTALALIDVHGKEMIRDGDERLTLNMRHDTSSHSSQPQKESINLINVFNNSNEDFLEAPFPNQPSGNPTFLPHPELTSLEVNNDIFDSEGCNVLSEKLLDLDSTKDLHPPRHDNPLSGSTTYFSNLLLEEFADELPSEYDDNLQFDIEFDLKEIEFMLYQDKDSSLKDLIDQKDLANLADIFVDSVPEIFTDEHALDYSSPRYSMNMMMIL
nr:reverse transcriptase domain-containing protein [Tanacetum cinerariifolium]